MTWITGTADNYLDLLADIATIVTANGGHILEQSSDLLYFYLEGDSGIDKIYGGIQAYSDAPNNRYNFNLFGSASWRSGRLPSKQPLNSGDLKAISYLWNSSIPYWVSINKRRLICVPKVSTVYQMFHIGFLDQSELAIDKHYPYPMLVGGSGQISTYNYSGTSQGAFWANQYASGRLMVPGGRWGNIQTSSQSDITPSITMLSRSYSLRAGIITALDGTYRPEQIYACDASGVNIYGAIDGLFRISGYENSAENIITIDGVNYMCFPDTYRSSIADYCCLKME